MVNTDDCWLWAGYKSEHGYGKYCIKIDGKWRMRYAHRLMYENFIGEIPEGLVIDHLCRVPTCVNPSHLEPVENITNILRGEAFTARNARKTHCPKGHEYSGDNLIYKRVKGQICRRCRACHNSQNRKYFAKFRTA